MAVTAISRDQRFTKKRPCPICGGGDNDPRGAGKRCNGFLSTDGAYAHCSREEHAGSLVVDSAGTYSHRLAGPCKCGATHGEAIERQAKREIVAVYPYRDEHGILLFEAVRYVPKDFRQRKPDGTPSIAGVRRVIYRYPEVLAADPSQTVYVVEGEKDVDNLRANGLVATCNPMGAGTGTGRVQLVERACLERAFTGRVVVIIADADEPGRKHAQEWRAALTGIAASTRSVELYNDDSKRDVSDWLAEGHTVAELAEIEPMGSQAGHNISTEWSYGSALNEWLGDSEPNEDDSSDWHIRGLVARDVPQFIAGDPKVGKTMIMESLGVSLALGLDEWCGFQIYGRKRVFLMPREDSERTTRIRLWQLARGAGLRRPHDLDGWLEVDPTSPLNLTNPEHMKKLRAACERFDVVFVDSFTTAHSGDENSARDVAAALEPARDLAMSTKTAIVFVHHYNGKGNADDKRGVKHRIRGSSAISGYARHILGVSNGPKRGQIEIASDGNLEFQVEPTVVELVADATENEKKTLAYRLVGKAKDAAVDSIRDELVQLVAEREDGYPSANAIWKDMTGNRALVLAAVKRELEPDGRLERRSKRICSRTLVLGTTQNQLVPSTGTGTAPYRGAPEPPVSGEDRQAAWSPQVYSDARHRGLHGDDE